MEAVGGGRRHKVNFYDVISPANLLGAWREFKRGKTSKSDVQSFAFRLEDNLFTLYERLRDNTWTPDPYVSFRVADPKPREIHKASVWDRILFQAVFRQLYTIFEKTFIHDSYASRRGKGVLAGVLRFEAFARKASRNYSQRVFVLKCDIRKFFDGIDHEVLFSLLRRKVDDMDLLELLSKIISSFEKTAGKGLPLGNVTSQLFANVYLNELDQFMKRELGTHYYIRYCDDFVIVSGNRFELEHLIPLIGKFLEMRLRLSLHPKKVSIRQLAQGLDFLGYVTFPGFRVLRTHTKRRMFTRCASVFATSDGKAEEGYAVRVLSSYKGLLSHSREYRSWKRLEKLYRNNDGLTEEEEIKVIEKMGKQKKE